MTISLMDAATFLWVASGTYGRSNAGGGGFTGGRKALSAALTTVRFTTQGGSDTTDLGNMNVSWE